MDSDKIAALCVALKLSDEEGPVQYVRGSLKEEGSQKMSLCLVCKLLVGHQTNMDAFRTLIPKIWCTSHEVTVELVRNNMFAFYFQNIRDKKRVFFREPWTFDNSLLVLEEPYGWGTVKEIDLRATGNCVGKFIRVKVLINISRPLKRGLRIQLKDTLDKQTLLFRYAKNVILIVVCQFTGQPSKDYLSVGGQRRDSEEANCRELFNDGGVVHNKEHMIGGPQSSRKGKEKIGDVIHKDSLLSKIGESPIKGESVDTLPIINERSQENLNDLNIRINPFTFKSPGIWTCT
ncbi:hypothetical protein JRO89_XS10G0079800 [Xanthoceras sorbifolium]|uniref:DUF4283 domain-containing protein n=1 Tax=Xanthoceras sorbifolium TaxID=99658 RepID=A0ABQ8HI00_9ROSI|nr:hypothetical protein JRO89_XS10G0079800 [Xanthoceras sorbifolium]